MNKPPSELKMVTESGPEMAEFVRGLARLSNHTPSRCCERIAIALCSFFDVLSFQSGLVVE